MIPSPALDRLVEQDTFAELLALLEPVELVIAALRLEGLSDDQIATLLGTTRQTVVRRMERAQARIVAALPELGPLLRGRRPSSLARRRPASPPLARGWICDWGQPDADDVLGPNLTVRQVARHYGVTRQAVVRWIRQGHFPGAFRVGQTYRVPLQDLI